MSADDIYRLLMQDGVDIGLATVYRVLTQFEQAGLLKRHHFEGGKAVFELNQGGHHDHLVCVQCGRVEEFYDPEIEKRLDALAKKTGRTKTFYAREAILEHLEDLEDVYLATERLQRPTKTYSAEDVKHELGL